MNKAGINATIISITDNETCDPVVNAPKKEIHNVVNGTKMARKVNVALTVSRMDPPNFASDDDIDVALVF